MKITREHFDYMHREIHGVVKHYGFERIEAHRQALKQQANVRDADKRLRHDLLYRAGLSTFVCDHVYKYADDTHVDTALRQIMKMEGIA